MAKRRGPRPGSEDTRQAILEAARTGFARDGYDRTTIRNVASAAGVDPSLVIHYFGSKRDLFAASVELPLRPDELMNRVFGDGGGHGEVARRLATLFFEVWEDESSRQPLLGQLRLAFASGEPPAIGGFIVDLIISRVGQLLDGPDAQLRVELAASHLVGIAVLRYVARIEPIASAPVDDLIAWVTPRLQSYLDPGAPSSL